MHLFDSLAPEIDTSFSTARRIPLDATSWIEHVPGWLVGSDALFTELRDTAAWSQRDRWMFTQRVTEPRLTAEYPDLSSAPQHLLHAVAEALTAHYGARYTKIWINLYRDHRDSTAWHGDVVGKHTPDCIVPVLSLGATRRFLIRPKAGGPSIGLQPAAGDLVVMGGRTQVDWQHCVPKQAKPADARISINFAPQHR